MATTRVRGNGEFGSAVLGACLVAAGAGGTGCSGVTIAPDDPAWTVTGEGRDGKAVWRAADVEIVVALRYPAGTRLVSADVWNRGPDPAELTFSVPGASAAPGVPATPHGTATAAAPAPLGTVSGRSPTFGETWSEPVLPGRPVQVPAGTPDAPGTIRLDLRPAEPSRAPMTRAVGDRFSFDIDVRTKSGSATCPLRFTVTKSSDGSWMGLSESDQVLVLVIVAILAIGIIALAGGGGSSGDDLEDYPMGN